jgi:hypothetical protein
MKTESLGVKKRRFFVVKINHDVYQKMWKIFFWEVMRSLKTFVLVENTFVWSRIDRYYYQTPIDRSNRCYIVIVVVVIAIDETVIIDE